MEEEGRRGGWKKRRMNEERESMKEGQIEIEGGEQEGKEKEALVRRKCVGMGREEGGVNKK